MRATLLLLLLHWLVPLWGFQSTVSSSSPHSTLPYLSSASRETTSSSLASTNENNNLDNPKRFRRLTQWLVKGSRRTVSSIQHMIKFQKIRAVFLLAMFSSTAVGIQRANRNPPPIEISYSSFMDLVEKQQETRVPSMDNVRIGSERITYRLQKPTTTTSGSKKAAAFQLELPNLTARTKRTLQQNRPYLSAFTRKIPASPELVNRLRSREIAFSAARESSVSTVGLAVRTFGLCIYLLFLYRLYQTMTGNTKKDTPGKLARTSDLPHASFDDIQGIDTVKYDVMELVDTLKNPDKYAFLGARAPTGLLLVGPPGTGKTLLARATASSAGVPLLYCSGSDFVEMFVGRGAARVRALFERASKLAPCIIFIDELDALGKSRETVAMRNDEADQTLNQLLACMDGLDSTRQICVLAATNRRDVLDSALIRPGRFDRIVQLELPDAAGRERILRVHTSKLPGFCEGTGVDTDRLNALGKGKRVDLSAIAAVTEGLSGAELEMVVNEAAIRSVRRVSVLVAEGLEDGSQIAVEPQDFEESLRNFFATRRNKGGFDGILRNVLKQ